MMILASGKQQTCVGLVIFLASAAAFVGHRSSNTLLLRHNEYLRVLLYAQQEQQKADRNKSDLPEASLPKNDDDDNDDGDPRKALEQFGSLFLQVQTIFLEGSNWDDNKLEAKTKEFVRTYIKVFVPGMGYAATSLAVYASIFFTVLLALGISGRGYTDLLSAISGIGPLHDLLEKVAVDPAWGNAAIALLGCELLSPVILAVTLLLTPKTMAVLRNQLDVWGWGEDDVDKRVGEILNL